MQFSDRVRFLIFSFFYEKCVQDINKKLKQDFKEYYIVVGRGYKSLVIYKINLISN